MGDVFVISVLVLIVGAVIWSMIKKKKSGKSCGCGCSECAMRHQCHGDKKQSNQ